MKKLWLVLALGLAGCKSNSIAKEKVDSSYQPSRMTGQLITGSGSNMYILEGDLNYYDADYNKTSLGSLEYADDKKVDVSQTISFKKYIDSVCGPIRFYDNHLYFLSERQTIEGNISYYLNSVDKRGEEREELLEIPYTPEGTLLIQNGNIYIGEADSNLTHIYDSSLKEVRTLDGSLLLVTNNHLYLYNSEKGCTQQMDMKEDSVVNLGDGTLVCATEDAYVMFQMEHPEEGTMTYCSTVYDSKTTQPLYTFEQEIVGAIDQKRIYATQLQEGRTSYQVYDRDGNPMQEIVPSASVQGEYHAEVLGEEMDFDQIICAVNDHIVTGTLQEVDGMKEYVYAACSIEDGTCKLLTEK